MIIVLSILSVIGIVALVVYIYIIMNPFGSFNYPTFLYESLGHYISWFLIIIGVSSLVGLYVLTKDILFVIYLTLTMLTFISYIIILIIPIAMPYSDTMGSLSGGDGLNFGGFQTLDFIEQTEILEEKRPGTRFEIIGEAYYLVFWLHKLPEISFLIGLVYYKSLSIAILFFITSYFLEIARFYLFGSSLFLSKLCRLWIWVKWPAFAFAIFLLWKNGPFLPIALLVFIVVQGFFSLFSTIGMLPVMLVIRSIAGRVGYSKYGLPYNNIECMALYFVINRWKEKILGKKNIIDNSSFDEDESSIYIRNREVMKDCLDDPWIKFSIDIEEEFFQLNQATIPQYPFEIWDENEVQYFFLAFALYSGKTRYGLRKRKVFNERELLYRNNIRELIESDKEIEGMENPCDFNVYLERESEYVDLLTKGSMKLGKVINKSIYKEAVGLFVNNACKEYIFSHNDFVDIIHPWIIEKGVEFNRNIEFGMGNVVRSKL